MDTNLTRQHLQTLSTVQTFFLAMAAHPEVQKRAQAELDAVVGPSRLPEFEDRDSLPYICALTKELLRWRTVVPLSIPHRSMQDDEYRGYLIPKGSLVIGIAWSGSPASSSSHWLTSSYPPGPSFTTKRCTRTHLRSALNAS